MTVREINLEKDFKIINQWLIDRGINNFQQELLSDSGFMISNNNSDIIVGFLYKTNSSVGYIENFISNPKSEKLERRSAINLLFKTIITEAQKLNYKILLTSAELHSLINNLKELDFQELPSNRVMYRSL